MKTSEKLEWLIHLLVSVMAVFCHWSVLWTWPDVQPLILQGSVVRQVSIHHGGISVSFFNTWMRLTLTEVFLVWIYKYYSYGSATPLRHMLPEMIAEH